jgi:hypothetical protein
MNISASEAMALQDSVQTALGEEDFAGVDSLDISGETSVSGLTNEELVAALESLDNSVGLIYSAEYGGAMLFADMDANAGAVDMEYLFIRMDEISTTDIVVNQNFVV